MSYIPVQLPPVESGLNLVLQLHLNIPTPFSHRPLTTHSVGNVIHTSTVAPCGVRLKSCLTVTSEHTNTVLIYTIDSQCGECNTYQYSCPLWSPAEILSYSYI